MFHLLLTHLEQYPLCGVQVPLQEESPPQFDFLGDIGLRCDQRLYSTRLRISRRPTTARGIDLAGGFAPLLALGELLARVDILALRTAGGHRDLAPGDIGQVATRAGNVCAEVPGTVVCARTGLAPAGHGR